MALHRLGQDVDAGQRREQHGDDPGHDQRNGDDHEHREAVFAGAALGETDRHEARHRHERARQHRKRRRRIGERRCLDLVEAFFELGHHHLDGDHGVVDQQSEGDDESAERDPLQRNAEQIHADEGDRENQGNGDCHDDSRPPAEREETDRENDGDGFPQALGELADSLVHDVGLVGDQMRVDADRQVARQLRDRFLMLVPSASASPFRAIAMARPIAAWPL